jgi:hypothetical protein
MKKIILLFTVIILSVVIYTQITLFVVQPIGAVPEGKTLVILRLNKTNFIDSADALCIREQGYLNILCRGMMLGAISKKSKILFKLPYNKYLYSISTKGLKFDK